MEHKRAKKHEGGLYIAICACILVIALIGYANNIAEKNREEAKFLAEQAGENMLAGEIEKPEEMHGESFLPLLKGEEVPTWRNSLYYHFYEYPAEHSVCRHFGVRTDRHKLIHYYNDIHSWELFYLQEDPSEMNNIYGKPGTEEITKELKTELIRLQEYYDDPIRNEIVIE